jgi:DNA repair protein RecN (Recombination protein N)
VIDELRVLNLGIIADAVVEPGEGLVVVTGETGAGKTMLLGALQLLLGEQARADAIGPHGDETRVEGRFVGRDDEVVATRRITSSGRSRAYLDGNMVSARELADRLAPGVEVVGQHDHLLITRPGALRALLDATLDAEGRTALHEYDAAWGKLQVTRAAQARLGGDRRELERELDLLQHQVSEITAAGPVPEEEGALGVRAARLRHVEELREGLAGAYDALEAAAGIDETVARLRRAAALDESLAGLADDAGGIQALTSDVMAGIRRGLESLEHEPVELADIEARIAVLAELKRKYGDTLEEVLDFQDRAARRANELAGLLQRADRLTDELHEQESAVGAAAERLHAARVRAAKEIEQGAAGHLRELGFAAPVVTVEVLSGEPGPTGADSVELRFASDESLTPAPARRSASGGELSRLVLSLRLASGVDAASVVAFDEIDAGVGGATALALGRKLKRLAVGRQVLCVTHLPQVAAFADTHLVVERAGAAASVRPVVEVDRIAEIARMLSGLPESERGQEHAEELLRLGRE